MTPPPHVALTGATGGLGFALARAYAEQGARLSLAGRDAARMATAADACRALGADVVTTLFDIRDREALRGWLHAADARAPLTLAIANAGVSCANGPEVLETRADAERVMEIDAAAAMATAAFAAELMLTRGSGRIAVVSSLAALLPLPSCPAYCAAKAGLRMYGLSLGAWTRSRGVGVTVVCPGYVETPMSRRLRGRKPFLWSADRAARHIRDRLARGPDEILFPFFPVLGLRLLSLLPRRLRALFREPLAFTVDPDVESPDRPRNRP